MEFFRQKAVKYVLVPKSKIGLEIITLLRRTNMFRKAYFLLINRFMNYFIKKIHNIFVRKIFSIGCEFFWESLELVHGVYLGYSNTINASTTLQTFSS